ncbi:DUF5672 family protein [Aestuariivivens insulae]|uniref:DUF5672 family protein n=1 Tax=Aestuariivivens insulae TaxID=1621988 RepID=UPI001F56D6EE|nr:DUF5672 family protein [Aestuariivivens insulae]
MEKNLVKVVIPIYKTDLTEGERKSLNQCVKVLGDYPIVFVQPKALDSSSIDFNGLISVETFDDFYFKDVFSYNALMLSEDFYSRFVDSEYILIYQLDAYVFKDELETWCLKGYDYIGAPWLASRNTLLNRFFKLFHSKKKKERNIIFFKVGNGGFSLRRISSCLEVTQELKEEIRENLKRKKDDFWIMEDVFWSIKVPTLIDEFTIPNYQEAVAFAVDRKPEIGFELNNNMLPFGCHGFEKPKVKEFWETKIN